MPWSLSVTPHASVSHPEGGSTLISMGFFAKDGTRPLAWVHTATGAVEVDPWLCGRPTFGLPPDARARLMGKVPRWLRTILEPLPPPAWWSTLLLFHRAVQRDSVQALRELADTDLTLVALLAMNKERGPRDLVHDEVVRCIGQPRRRLLSLLDFRCEPWVLRALRKVRADCLEEELLEQLLSMLASEDRNVIRILQHIPEINPIVVHVLDHETLKFCVAPSFVYQVHAEEGRESGLRQAAWDAMGWAEGNEERLPDHLKTVEQLIRLQEQAVQECARRPANAADVLFLNPPFGGLGEAGCGDEFAERHGPLAPHPSTAVKLRLRR
jgi:hypothetical protein